MSERGRKDDYRTVLLVDAVEQEIALLRKEMPNWVWKEAPEGWPFDKESMPLDDQFDAIIIFARKDGKDRVLDIYRTLCDEKIIDGMPLLVAVSRYQMLLVNKLRGLAKVDCIFTPIKGKKLLNKIKKDSNVIA
jgi:hypothetical protein